MTLSFSTTWPARMGGEPTHFVEKIWAGLDASKKQEMEYYDGSKGLSLFTGIAKYPEWKGTNWFAPKLHTFREDPHDRWKVGMKIHPVINNRTPQRFQFAPTMECKGIHYISILWMHGYPTLHLGPTKESMMPWYWDDPNDPENGYGIEQMEAIAINDGFDSIEHFFQWFNKDFTGKIIHWTDLKY